jgi:hypothetical protein
MSQRLRRVMRHLSPFALALFAGDCLNGGGWEQTRIEEPTPLEPWRVVSVWSGGKVEKWHAVVITPDSVSGIPYKMSLECDSCRRSLPRAQVDSMKVDFRTGPPKGVARTSLEMAGALVAVLLLEVVVCTAARAKSGC